MTPQKNERVLHPLRRVVNIDVSEEMGPDLGNPHYFWLDRRYTMTLECGHQEARVKFNHKRLPPEEFMPKRVRCKACPGMSVPAKKRATPPYDYLASSLVGAIFGVGDGNDEDIALAWVQEHGKWIEDDRHRAAIYGAVAVFLFDAMLDDKTVKRSDALRAAIEAWAADPTDGTKAEVRRAARRVYDTQKADGNDWYTARALICLGRIASMGTASARGVVEALTWDKNSREEFYERLWSARHTMDYQASRQLLVAGVSMDMEDRDEALKEVIQETESAREELSRIWNDEYPQVGGHHLPLLHYLLEVYAEAKKRIEGTPSA